MRRHINGNVRATRPGSQPGRWVALSLVTILGLLLAACAVPEPQEPATPVPVPTIGGTMEEAVGQPAAPALAPVGIPLVLVAMADEADPLVVEPGSLVTATFAADGTVSGSAGCNDYSAPYTAGENNTLTVGPVVTTLKVCEVGMDQEAAYLQALESAQSYAITEDSWLQVTYATGSAGNTGVLVFGQGAAPLAGTLWVLEAFGAPAEAQPVPAGTTITATFRPTGVDPTMGEVVGSAGCNDYTAAYVTDDDRIIVKNPMATRKLCPESVMDREQAYLQALSDAERYTMVGQRLELSYDDGRGVLVFSSLHLPLEDTLWRLAALNGEAVALELDVTAILVPGDASGQGTVSGTGGCNSYSGAYTVDGGQLTVGVLAATARYCPAGSELETAYLAELQAAESYQILGDRLEIASAQGTLFYLADRTPLEETVWDLVSYGPTTGPIPVVPGSDATATFEREPRFPSGLVTGSTGCNDYSAAYAATLDRIAINPPVVTRRACVPGLAEQEQQLVQGLAAADSYRILGNVLQLFYLDGQQALTFLAAGSIPPVLPTPVPTPPVQVVPPRAVLDMPSEAQANQAVLFSGTRSMAGSYPITAYRWDFGDGRTASGATIQRAYAKPGTFTVTLTVVDSAGLSDSTRGQIRIVPALVGPKAVIEGPSQAVVGQLVTFTSKSQQGSSPIVSYAWDLSGAPRTAGTQGSSVTTVYSAPGTYKIALTVTDANGLKDTASKQIQILPAAPVGPKAVIEGPSQAMVGQSVTFTSKSQQGSSPIVSYAWDLSGAPRTAGTQGSSVTTVYSAPGTYTVSLTVTDANGLKDTASKQIQILPAAPVGPTAVIEGPSQAMVGEEVTFTSKSRPGSSQIVSYAWDLSGAPRAAGTQGSSVTTVYNAPGTYAVSLTVTDKNGLSDTETKQIQIVAAPEKPVLPTPVIVAPSEGMAGQAVTFDGSQSRPGNGGDIVNYEWRFGDGGTARGMVVQHAYSQAGGFQVVLIVTDASGRANNTLQGILVKEVPPPPTSTPTPTAIPTPTPTATPTGPGLEGTVWSLASAMPGTTITLQFSGGNASGSAGCNTYSGGYSASGGASGAISFASLAVTEKLCEESVMVQEQQYLAALGAATSYTIEGPVLTLATGLGPLTFFAQGAPTPY